MTDLAVCPDCKAVVAVRDGKLAKHLSGIDIRHRRPSHGSRRCPGSGQPPQRKETQ